VFKVFYSWQSDLPWQTNRGLILDALEESCSTLKSEGSIAVEPVIDRDTLGLSGAPDISETILEKIREADVFVADVSLVNGPRTVARRTHFVSERRRSVGAVVDPGRDEAQRRPTPNPNVLVELGYALAHLGNEALVLVVNTHFGPVEQLPFDLRSLLMLNYQAHPADTDVTAVKKDLVVHLASAINKIALAVRSDPLHAIVYPRTLNVTGQAEDMLRGLIKAAGETFDEENITEPELRQVCERMDPNGKAQGWHDASWIDAMCDWRARSRKFTADILVFSPFLKREHVALLAVVEQCSYFAQLEPLRGSGVGNKNLGWLSSALWEYVKATRRLKHYAVTVLARRADRF
jgi:hypothetical protein